MHTLLIAAEGPETSLTKKGSQVNLQGSEEVFVFEVHHLSKEVFHEDTNKPDLLVGHKTASTFIESVFSKLVLETFTKFVEVGLMKVLDLLLVHTRLVLLKFSENGCQNFVVFLKELSHIVKVSHTKHDSLSQEKVSLLDILLGLHCAVQKEKLEGRLSVASLVGSQEEFFCFVEVLRNTMAFHVVDAHPVISDDITLFSGNHVVVASPCFVAFNVRLGSAELGESASSTARL
jgi:hypothetical protein